MPAVKNGMVASITITSATLESLSALRKQTVDSAEQSAISSPSRPIARTAATNHPCSRHSSTAVRNRPAKIPRQNSIVMESTWTSRVKKPAVL